MSYTGRRWLVFGASGQLGTALANALGKRDQDAVLLSRSSCDVTDATELEKQIKRYRPEVAINAAAYTQVDEAEASVEHAYRVNAEGPANLARAASAVPGCFVIQVSTDYVFGGKSTMLQPYHEDHPVSPLNVYGRSKAAGEAAVRAILPNRSAVARTSWLYEAGFPNFVSTVVERAMENAPITVVNDQWGQPTRARELAEHICDLGAGLAAGSLPSGTFHVSGSGSTTWFDLASWIYRRLGADHSLILPALSRDLRRAASRPHWSVLGHDAWNRTGLSPLRPWEVVLEEALPEILERIKLARSRAR